MSVHRLLFLLLLNLFFLSSNFFTFPRLRWHKRLHQLIVAPLVIEHNRPVPQRGTGCERGYSKPQGADGGGVEGPEGRSVNSAGEILG